MICARARDAATRSRLLRTSEPVLHELLIRKSSVRIQPGALVRRSPTKGGSVVGSQLRQREYGDVGEAVWLGGPDLRPPLRGQRSAASVTGRSSRTSTTSTRAASRSGSERITARSP